MLNQTWIIRNLQTILVIIVVNKLLDQIYAQDENKCIDIKRYYNQKSGYIFKDAIELPGSNVLLLRATSEGEGNFFTIIDASSHQVLHSFSIDSHIKQMIFCQKKNKLLTISQDKLIERHLLQFDIIRTYQIPNIIMVEDIPEYDEEVLLLIQDQRAARFNLTSGEATGKYPIKMQGQKYPIQNSFTKFINLLEFKLYVRGGSEALEIYSIDGQPIGCIFTNEAKSLSDYKIVQSDIVGIQGTNLIAFQHNLKEIVIWEIKINELNVLYYVEKLKQSLPKENPQSLLKDKNPYKLHYLSKNNQNYLVIFSSSNQKRLKDSYHEVFVYKIALKQTNLELNVELVLAEIWQNTSALQFSALSLFQQSKRVFGILNNQHLSFELLEHNTPGCDYNNDFELDYYCRTPKILNFKRWDDSFGVFLLQDGNIMIPNSFYGILEIRNSQMKEVHVKNVYLLRDSSQTINRVFIPSNSNNRFLENQNKLNKLDIFMWYIQDYEHEYSFNVYDYKSDIVLTYNFEDLFNQIPLKLELNKSLVASYIWKNNYVGCLAFSYPDVNNFQEDFSQNDIQKLKDLQSYFSNHNLECYEMSKDGQIQQHNLNRYNNIANQVNKEGDKQTIAICTVNEQMSMLICMNNNSEILYWELDNYKAKERTEIHQCVETTRLVSSGDFIYFNCLNFGTIQQYNMKTKQFKFISKRPANQLFLIKNGSLLVASAFQYAGFQIFDVNLPENSKPLFQFEDKQVCCKTVYIDFDENENNVIIMSKDALITVNLSECRNNYSSCLKCSMEAYISQSSEFSYIYQQDISAKSKVSVNDKNPRLMSIGNGSKENPYISDLQIIELYFKADVLKNLLTEFKQITIQIFFDSTKVNSLNKYFFDWIQEKSFLQIMSYQPIQDVKIKNKEDDKNTENTTKNSSHSDSTITDNQELKLPSKPAYVTILQKMEVKVKYWNSLHMHYINIICPLCGQDLNVTISYMTNLTLNNVQFLKYESKDKNDINNAIFQELKRLKFIQQNNTVEGEIDKDIKPLIRYIYPTIYLKRINFTVIDQLQLINLTINQPILNLISCQEILIQNMIFDSNIVSSQIITSQQTFLQLQSINFTNNQFIHGKNDKLYQSPSFDQYGTPLNQTINYSFKKDTNKLMRNLNNKNLTSDKKQDNNQINYQQNQPSQTQSEINFDKDNMIKTNDSPLQGNRTIILITFQNIYANSLLIKNNTFFDHLFFQGFIENQQFSQKTNFIFEDIKFEFNTYCVYTLPKVLFIQILLEVFLIAQHDVSMKQIHFQENSQTLFPDIMYERKHDSYYIELSMIRNLCMENISIKYESLVGLVETKMVSFIQIIQFTFNDIYIRPDTLEDEQVKKKINNPPKEDQQDFQNKTNENKQENDNKESDNNKRILKLYNSVGNPSESKISFQDKYLQQNNHNSQQNKDQIIQTKNKTRKLYQDGDYSEFTFPLRMFSNSLIKLSETEDIQLEAIEFGYLHFVNTIVISIYNKQKSLQSLTISECKFYHLQINSLSHFTQVNLILINAESSFSSIFIFNNTFTNITLYYSTNSEMKSSSAITVFSLKSNATLFNNLFQDMYTSSAIGPLSFDVCFLRLESSQFINNIHSGLRISESEISSLNIGGFVAAKVDQILIYQVNFTNSFSTRGALFVKPNLQKLQLYIEDTNFDYIFSFSSPGSAIFIDSSQSLLKMNMSNCNFSNIVTINTQYTYAQSKSVIHIQKDYSAQKINNTIIIQNIIIQNIITQFYEKKDGHFLSSFQQSFNSFFLIGSIINLLLNDITIISNRHDSNLIQFLQYIEKFKYNQFKFENEIQVNTSFIHSTIFQVQNGYVTCSKLNYLGQKEEVDLLQTFEATEENFIEISKLKKNLIQATQTGIYFTYFTAEHLLTTKFIDIQEGEDTFMDSIYFYNLEQIIFPNLIYRTNIFKLQTESMIELKKIDSLIINKLEVFCDGIFKSKQSFNSSTQKEPNEQKMCFGQILFIQDSNFFLGNSIFSSYYSPSNNGTAVYIQNPYGNSTLSQNIFVNLRTDYCGSAIYIFINSALYLPTVQVPPVSKKQMIFDFNNNLYLQNESSLYGGSIYIENIDPEFTKQILFKLVQNNFIKNSAQLGSSLFYKNVVPQIEETNKYKLNNDDNDKASIFSTPHHIRIIQTNEILPLLNLNSNIYNSNGKSSDFIGDISVASGQKLPPLRFQLLYINSFSQEKKLVRLDLLSINIPKQDIIQLYLEYPFNQIEQKQTINSLYLLKNKDDIKFDLKNNYIEFTNLEFFGPLNTNTTLYVSSPLIQYENKQTNTIDKNITFKINIHFRPCNQFEIIISSDLTSNQLGHNISQCQKCLDQTFSKDQQLCSECPIGAICKYGQTMKIQEGYWRPSYDSYDIIQCNNQVDNCKGGEGIGNQLCKEGHIGALCEECDIFGEVWKYRYSHQGVFKCQRCDQLAISYIFILISHLLTLVIAISSIVSNSESIKIKTIKAIYKQTRKNNKWTSSKSNQSQQNISEENEELSIQSGANLKILASYFSIMSSMSNFKFSLPKIVPEVSSVVGSPIAISMNAIDCLLVQMPLSRIIPFIYFQYIIKILFPFMLLMIILIILVIWNCAKKYKFQSHYVHTTILFLYIYLQPDLVYEAINLISCRQIAGIKFILGNVSFKCSDENKVYEFGLVYPIFICLVFIIPICLLTKLIRNKLRLRKIRFQLRWGILYHEYIDQCFYWEFVKISEKLFIILTISIFNSYQNIQLGVLIVILIFYLIYLFKMQPFMKSKDNSMEFFSNFTILLTIKQIKLYQSIIILVLLVFVNLTFILFISTKIYVEQYELFKQKKPELFLKCPTIDKFLNYLSQKLQQGWRRSADQNNSFLSNKRSIIGSNRFIEKIIPRKKVIIDRKRVPSIQNQSFNVQSNQDQDGFQKYNNDTNQIQIEIVSYDQNKKKSEFVDQDEVEEFNSFGYRKTSLKLQQDNEKNDNNSNMDCSVNQLSSSNLDVSSNQMQKQSKQLKVPVSDFQVKSQTSIQFNMNMTNQSNQIFNNRSQMYSSNSLESIGGIVSKQSLQALQIQQSAISSNPQMKSLISKIKNVTSQNHINLTKEELQQQKSKKKIIQKQKSKN